jgi:putative ABC transport system ATP-binding protein
MQRTALARALRLSPSILLADEPTASLDRENKDTVTDLLLQAVREEGVTLVVVTHQPRLVDRAPRAIRLEHGRIVAGPGTHGGAP